MSETLIAPETAAAPERAPVAAETPRRAAHVLRFDRVDRTLHGFLMLSFLGLAFTGMPVLFSTTPWAGRVARLLGGYTVIHRMHRVFATIMIVVFIVHVGRLLRRVVARKDYSVFWGPASMVPQPRDLADMVQHIRWFVGLGPRPAFDRYTYWEKFDYWAVFWGMAIIGGSGLLLWFPVAFARVMPGWAFNIALLVHGEEALLAVGFIFTIHFFNSHLRPEKFPMDMVIFTGRVPEHEWRDERPAEYARLAGDAPDAGPPSGRAWIVGRVIGSAAVAAGLVLVALIAFALITSL
ncbi:MAG TPA: cytochrome b/b6 domain-containing protein [Vicinamibacterales bacterium]|nr:cytochrome b/b6 domain-containing protein [Vicinamibacterales bacterium]